jgi:ubiquitin-conjugating enzyme E2 R
MALKILQNSYRQLQRDPVEGFAVEPHEDDFFNWTVWIEAPKDTPFEGGIFELELKFPSDFPMSPPELKFVSEFWHPNVFQDGRVCISILHPPVDDPMSGELPQERWLPTQTVSTIILSVLSILGDPNFSSPANVDASVECKQQPEVYKKRVRKLVEKARARLPSHVKIPHPESDMKERAKAIERHRILTEAQAIDDDFINDGDDYGDFDIDIDGSNSSDFDYEGNYSDDEFTYNDVSPDKTLQQNETSKSSSGKSQIVAKKPQSRSKTSKESEAQAKRSTKTKSSKSHSSAEKSGGSRKKSGHSSRSKEKSSRSTTKKKDSGAQV